MRKGMQVRTNRGILIDQKNLTRGQNHQPPDLYSYYIGVGIEGATPPPPHFFVWNDKNNEQ